MAYTQEWLVQNDYLPRPDPNGSGYAAWLKAVSRPMTIAHKEPIALLSTYADNYHVVDGPNWAGLALSQGVQYLQVYGVFNVPPTYTYQGVVGSAYVWVGLDGQKGTAGANQVLQVGIFATWPETYYPWIEYWPGNQIKISNLAVNFNDQLFVVAYSGTNYCSSFSTTGVEACGGIDDITTGFSSGTWLAPKPSGASFVGTTAEFIVERICVTNCLPNQQNPTYDALLNFQQIWIDGEAEDSAGNWRDFATDFYWEDQIQNASNQTLATSQDSNGTSTEVVTFYQSR